MIDTSVLRETFLSCFFTDEEIREGEKDRAIFAEGVQTTVGFHPERLEGTREQVKTWLSYLPDIFQSEGHSFLNGCMLQNGQQWGEHQNVEQLFQLGIGLGMVICLVPREVWPMLPGGMPYYKINLNISDQEAMR